MVRTLSSPHASSQILPCHDSPGQLAESFCSFFDEKVKRIRQELDASISEDLSVPVKDRYSVYPTGFHTVSEDELVNIIKGTSDSYCELDPIPTSLLKKVISYLAPVLVKIVNTSLQKGEVPACTKHAIVQPRLKKDGLPHDDVSSYRPIADLSFVGKLVERVVARKIREYLADHDLLPSAQSAYREHFSVETALLRVQNDLLMALDARQNAVLVLLDFSAARYD